MTRRPRGRPAVSAPSPLSWPPAPKVVAIPPCPRTLPAATASTRTPAWSSTCRWMGAMVMAQLGQHHGSAFYHVYTKVLPRLLDVRPLLDAYPNASLLLSPARVSKGLAAAVSIPATRLHPSPPAGTWIPEAVVVAPPPFRQEQLVRLCPVCGGGQQLPPSTPSWRPPPPLARWCLRQPLTVLGRERRWRGREWRRRGRGAAPRPSAGTPPPPPSTPAAAGGPRFSPQCLPLPLGPRPPPERLPL